MGEEKKMNSGITIDQVTELLAQSKGGRINRDHLQRLLENPDSFNQNVSRWARSFWSVEIDYDQGVDAMVKANKFDYKNDDITGKNFPLQHKGKRVVENLELAQFDESVTGEEAASRLEAMGYQVEDIGALLAFGVAYPNEQRRRPIVALGSRWSDRGGYVGVPCLGSGDTYRRLRLGWITYDFNPDYRFLVSRK